MISSRTKSKLVICMRVRRPANRKTTKHEINGQRPQDRFYTEPPLLKSYSTLQLWKHELVKCDQALIIHAYATVQHTEVFRLQSKDDYRRCGLCVGFKCIKESVDADA